MFQILAEIARIVPTEILSLTLQRDLELPSRLFENRLRECPTCQESFSYMDKYFPVKENELDLEDTFVAAVIT